MRTNRWRGKVTCAEINAEDNKSDIDNNGWVYGYYVPQIASTGGAYILGQVIESSAEECLMEYWYPVKPDTLGQFTGQKDDNGKDIYEGDIIQTTKDDLLSTDAYIIIAYCDSVGFISYRCYWDDVETGFTLSGRRRYSRLPNGCWQIVGNIHDNPAFFQKWIKRFNENAAKNRKAKK